MIFGMFSKGSQSIDCFHSQRYCFRLYVVNEMFVFPETCFLHLKQLPTSVL